MSGLNPYGHIKPTTNRFEQYLDELRERWKFQKVRPQRIHGAIALLRELERSRLSFSKLTDRAFTTKKISNQSLADRLGYQTYRQVQKYREWLEGQDILKVIRPKLNKFLNDLNRYEFADFKMWFSTRFQQVSSETGHPIKNENDPRSLFQKKPRLCFPTQDLVSWDKASKFWKLIAQESLRDGERLPCLKLASAAFRVNLRKHQIPFDHPSIIARWKSFVRRRLDFNPNERITP